MIPSRTIAIKVDVDTRSGMQRGVPALLEIFARHKVPATFFLSFGPDRSGTAIWQVFKQKGFLKKMLRTNALKMYGLRTILSGTILPAKPIAADCPDLVRRIEKEGHEVGIHAWDHRLWQDKLDRLPQAAVREQIALASASFEKILGRKTRSIAAPAWRVNPLYLQIEDEMKLLYASDSRGQEPFTPRMEERTFRTPQFPTTIPCIEEIIAAGSEKSGLGLNRFPQLIESLREEGLNVFPAHAEVEGTLYGREMGEFIEISKERGYSFATLEQLARESMREGLPPVKELRLAALPGRASLVAVAV